MPQGTTCVAGSFNYISLTPDGYITISAMGGPAFLGKGRIIISNVNATSVSVATNDGSGTVFSNPFDCTSVVPLNLLSLEGISKQDCNVVLKWETGNEASVKNIEIQRSENGIIFKKIADLLPKGSNSSYFYETATNSSAFFRLQINDVDGSYNYSKIIKVNSSCNKSQYTIFPNPSNEIIQISGLQGGETIIIYDLAGGRVLSLDKIRVNRINISSLLPGIYFVQISRNNTKLKQIKFIKG